MQQTKRASAVETAIQVSVKAVTATLLWMLIRRYAMEVPAVCVTAVFMVNSFVLGYAIRRASNYYNERATR